MTTHHLTSPPHLHPLQQNPKNIVGWWRGSQNRVRPAAVRRCRGRGEMAQHFPAGFLTDGCWRNLAPEGQDSFYTRQLVGVQGTIRHIPLTYGHCQVNPYPSLPFSSHSGPFWVTLGNNGGPSSWYCCFPLPALGAVSLLKRK